MAKLSANHCGKGGEASKASQGRKRGTAARCNGSLFLFLSATLSAPQLVAPAGFWQAAVTRFPASPPGFPPNRPLASSSFAVPSPISSRPHGRPRLVRYFARFASRRAASSPSSFDFIPPPSSADRPPTRDAAQPKKARIPRLATASRTRAKHRYPAALPYTFGWRVDSTASIFRRISRTRLTPRPTVHPSRLGHSTRSLVRASILVQSLSFPPRSSRASVISEACASSIKGIVAALTLLSHTETAELSLQQHLDISPDLVAYPHHVATEVDPEPLMMAQQVPHQATDKRRVKVYELRNNDWYDRGTGFCTASFATTEDGRKDPRVIVESEDQPERLLLETKIQKEDGFQKQQDTLIVWQEPASGVDMALSFQEADGCAMIWRFVSNVQQTFHNSLTGADDSLSDDLTVEYQPPTVTLPAAELGNLQEVEAGMRIMSNTANGRDALAKFIMADDYIGKLIPLVEMAEDLESLPDLHRLCNIMKSVILLNDTTIIEHAVSDENVLGVVGALEYDPDFPSHKANHRHWLDNQGRYKEVVPIEDEPTRRKIHQTYRLQYLKDVVLARILDDPTFSVLNSLIFFNQVDIVQHLQSNGPFLNDLFGIFTSPQPDHRRKKEAVLFIQQCCAIAKTIQPPARQTLYNNFIAHGLLQVIHFGLRHDDVAVRIGATDILVSIIDHDAQMIRQTIYRQMHENQPSLTDTLIELLLVEVDLGVKAQISEAVKVLLDQTVPGQGPEVMTKANGEFHPRPRPQQTSDPQQELFLTRFYDRSALKLFKPLLDLETRTDLSFSVQQASMFSYLIEILGFFIRQHHRFSRYFVMNHNIVERVIHLIKSPEKYLRLVAIRFFRGLVHLQEEFYIKQMTEKGILGPILEVLIATMPRDNLLSSACLDLFESIRKENVKDLIKHLAENYRDRLVELNYMPTFRDLVLRYDQTQGYTTDTEYFLESEVDMTRRQPPNTRLMEHITVDPQEEDYWETSDPEDESEESNSANSNGSTQSRPLVDYASDEEGDEAAADQGDVKDDADDNKVSSPKQSETPDVTPPERISEKRRREEEEDEDELGKLVASKRRHSGSSETHSPAPNRLGQRRRSFSAGAGNPTPKKIAISLSPALKSGGNLRLDDES